MIAIDSITEKELEKRFNALPDKLKETLTSDRNLKIVNEVCDKNRIAGDEKRATIEQIVGLVLLGMVHYYDVGAEIDDALGLNNPKFSNSVADELNAKVFSPIKSELESNYHPLATTTMDIEQPKTNAGPPATAPKVVTPSAPSISKPATQVPVPPFPPPAPLPGWSQGTSTEPVVRLNQAAVPTPTPAPAPPSAAPPSMPKPMAPPSPKPAAPPAATDMMDEFERLAKQSAEKGAAAPSAPSTAGTEPPPVMLHHDTEFRAQPQAPGFHLELPEKPIDMRAGSSARSPLKSAVLEFGSIPPAAPKPGPMTTRVVHYSEYKSPSPERPVQPQPVRTQVAPAAQGPRHLTEITAQETPFATPMKPPAPAVRPMMPSPPTIPPQAQPMPDKVIHKDYSATNTPTEPPQAQPPAPPVPPKP